MACLYVSSYEYLNPTLSGEQTRIYGTWWRIKATSFREKVIVIYISTYQHTHIHTAHRCFKNLARSKPSITSFGQFFLCVLKLFSQQREQDIEQPDSCMLCWWVLIEVLSQMCRWTKQAFFRFSSVLGFPVIFFLFTRVYLISSVLCLLFLIYYTEMSYLYLFWWGQLCRQQYLVNFSS